MGVTVFGASGQQITLDWDFDQGNATSSSTIKIEEKGAASEWNVAEWGLSEFSGGIALSKLKSSASRMGRTVSLGLTFNSNGNAMSVEQMSLFAKIGRDDK